MGLRAPEYIVVSSLGFLPFAADMKFNRFLGPFSRAAEHQSQATTFIYPLHRNRCAFLCSESTVLHHFAQPILSKLIPAQVPQSLILMMEPGTRGAVFLGDGGTSKALPHANWAKLCGEPLMLEGLASDFLGPKLCKMCRAGARNALGGKGLLHLQAGLWALGTGQDLGSGRALVEVPAQNPHEPSASRRCPHP